MLLPFPQLHDSAQDPRNIIPIFYFHSNPKFSLAHAEVWVTGLDRRLCHLTIYLEAGQLILLQQL